ncbi:MAG: hypothetical protein QOD29_96 [Alphaproteobacteria bacterium]|nr:hypothetical protein [Alphaproteobacteria bacterium]
MQCIRRGLLWLQGRHCLFRCGARESGLLAHSPRSGTTKKDQIGFKSRVRTLCSWVQRRFICFPMTESRLRPAILYRFGGNSRPLRNAISHGGAPHL